MSPSRPSAAATAICLATALASTAVPVSELAYQQTTAVPLAGAVVSDAAGAAAADQDLRLGVRDLRTA